QNIKLISVEDPEGNLPLHEAARKGDAELYRELVKLGANPAQKNTRGETVLMHAALSGDAETLAEALKGISPELLQAKDKDGHNAHYYAKLAQDKAATEALKAAGLQP
ncbi:MAG: ankyrin repeat domain-containing protein, partial [Akkermansiaceae bacterium]|nr:ankyrin repeat domain-containing protein [Akkermansiaceae bacterium]